MRVVIVHLPFLCIDYLVIDNFGCTVSAGIHPPDPFHLVVGFQRFRNALCICHLLYQPKKKLLCLSVNIRKI